MTDKDVITENEQNKQPIDSQKSVNEVKSNYRPKSREFSKPFFQNRTGNFDRSKPWHNSTRMTNDQENNDKPNPKKQESDAKKLSDILNTLSIPTVDDLANAGVLYGENKTNTHPKMMPYIYKDETLNTDLRVINLEITHSQLQKSCEFLFHEAAKGHQILFIGTGDTCKELIKECAELVGMSFVNNKWTSGLLTNFQTVLNSMKKKKQIEETLKGNTLTKKERAIFNRKLEKQKKYDGIESMHSVPSVLVIVGGNKEKNAIEESQKLNKPMPIVGLLDTDCNPTGISYLIPGNDDSRDSIKIILDTLSKYIMEGIKYYASTRRVMGANTLKEKYGFSMNGQRFQGFRKEYKYNPQPRKPIS